MFEYSTLVWSMLKFIIFQFEFFVLNLHLNDDLILGFQYKIDDKLVWVYTLMIEENRPNESTK